MLVAMLAAFATALLSSVTSFGGAVLLPVDRLPTSVFVVVVEVGLVVAGVLLVWG
jgi:hypothetical protein